MRLLNLLHISITATGRLAARTTSGMGDRNIETKPWLALLSLSARSAA
jgi:hypothetical protein